MGLIHELACSDKHGLFVSDDAYIMHSTGFMPLDFANGFWKRTVDANGNEVMVPAVGVMGGTFTGIIGATSTGKTTLADQMGYKIIEPYEDGLLIHVDAEKTSNKDRILQITGAKDDGRIILNKQHTTIDDVLDMVTAICEKKQALGSKCMIDSGMKDRDRKSIKVYVPTVIIIDSLPSFNEKSYNVTDLGTNADGMTEARATTKFYTKCLDRAWRYNINFFVINHIKPKVDMNQYSQPPKGLLLLGQGEHLPRGQVAQYYSQTYFRIRTRKSDAYTIEDDGFKGYRSTIELAKSKTNSMGTIFPIAFNTQIGFDPVYSIYEFAKSCGMLRGRNPYLYFEGLEALKFNRKDFRKKMIVEKEFSDAVLSAMMPVFESMLSKKPEYDTEKLLNDGFSLDYGNRYSVESTEK